MENFDQVNQCYNTYSMKWDGAPKLPIIIQR